MNKQLSIPLAGVVLLTLLGAPISALADDQNQPPIFPSNVQILQDDDDELDDDDVDDDEDDDEDEDDDDHKKGWIPPVFVVPGKKHEHHKPKPGVPSSITPFDTSDDDDDDTTAGTAGTTNIDGVESKDFVVVGVDDTTATKSLESVDPRQAQPVAIEQVRVTSQTPADRFMDTAYLGIGIMAVSALGLGATTAIRSYRLRKSGKSDYFYDN
ncbi:MAG: hypothetical protein RLZ53_1215 [Actinomycetota bacterium]|jgi:hypothetical protein